MVVCSRSNNSISFCASATPGDALLTLERSPIRNVVLPLSQVNCLVRKQATVPCNGRVPAGAKSRNSARARKEIP